MMRAPRSPRTLRVLAVATLLSVSLAQNDFKARMTAMLPENNQVAEIMEFGYDQEIQNIQERFRQAERQDPRWFRDWRAAHADDPILPYHVKFGVSAQEYERLLTDKGLRLVRTGRTARLNVTVSGGRMIFQGGSGAEALKGIVLNLNTGELRVPESSVVARPQTRYVNGRGDVLGLGTRSGWGWEVSSANPQSRVNIWANFTLMQFSNGTVLLAFKKAALVDNRYQPEIDLTLFYDRKNVTSGRAGTQ
ncbi:hypothetical protein [Deinococcus pimensis]|uniref:hypothetical protein n=1 Tax=Deinococcus pimensis TaxID=309888 RepID=UPI0012F70C07|nr:hypothetical protein [Deinococcus pimensis]